MPYNRLTGRRITRINPTGPKFKSLLLDLLLDDAPQVFVCASCGGPTLRTQNHCSRCGFRSNRALPWDKDTAHEQRQEKLKASRSL